MTNCRGKDKSVYYRISSSRHTSLILMDDIVLYPHVIIAAVLTVHIVCITIHASSVYVVPLLGGVSVSELFILPLSTAGGFCAKFLLVSSGILLVIMFISPNTLSRREDLQSLVLVIF